MRVERAAARREGSAKSEAEVQRDGGVALQRTRKAHSPDNPARVAIWRTVQATVGAVRQAVHEALIRALAVRLQSVIAELE